MSVTAEPTLSLAAASDPAEEGSGEVGGRLDTGDVYRASRTPTTLRILFMVSAHNGLSQLALIELSERGHEVTVAVVESAADMEAAVAGHRPQLIICPFLKTLIPASIWSQHRCLIVHPGPPGDRGPSSLDWAIELGTRDWGATVLEANDEADAGTVWAARPFEVPEAGKSSVYRHEVRHAAIAALIEAVDAIVDGRCARNDHADRVGVAPHARELIGRPRPLMSQEIRAIDWHADVADTVIRKIRAGEGHPGVLDEVQGIRFHLFGAHHEGTLRGRPGEIIAQRDGAICRTTVDGAVWITHLKSAGSSAHGYFKLPAARALILAGHRLDVPEVRIASDAQLKATGTYREITYHEHNGVGYLQFDFYNGAMSTEQCHRLQAAVRDARFRHDTRVIVLMGGRDYFSNGIHLNVIEAAEDPAAESWRNLKAIDDVVCEILQTDSHLVISALGGDAGAGGVPLALAADCVFAREDIVLNPYYQHMGGLYGSEYWTYLLPRRVGTEMTKRLTGAPFTPVGTRRAAHIGLIDAAFGATLGEFRAHTRTVAERLAAGAGFDRQLEQKRGQRVADEHVKTLQTYRDEELARSYECFFGPDPSYHRARRRFVYKQGPVCAVTPPADATRRTP
jgi:putative two-component system protein, hydrogenase maturation factor HypX/HoxX